LPRFKAKFLAVWAWTTGSARSMSAAIDPDDPDARHAHLHKCGHWPRSSTRPSSTASCWISYSTERRTGSGVTDAAKIPDDIVGSDDFVRKPWQPYLEAALGFRITGTPPS